MNFDPDSESTNLFTKHSLDRLEPNGLAPSDLITDEISQSIPLATVHIYQSDANPNLHCSRVTAVILSTYAKAASGYQSASCAEFSLSNMISE